MVSSWIYAVAQEVLDESLGLSIPRASSSLECPRKRSLARPQSLSKRRSSSQTSSKPTKALSSIREAQGEETQSDALSLTDVRAIENYSLASACAQRAELCLLQRRVLTRLAESIEFSKSNGASGNSGHQYDEEDDDSHNTNQGDNSDRKLSLISTFSEQLSQSLSTLGDYQRLFEVLSENVHSNEVYPD